MRERFPIFFIYFIGGFGLCIAMPLIAPYILKPEFGFFSSNVPLALKNIYAGILLAAFPCAQFFGCPFFGDIADQWGRKRALYCTSWGTFFGFFLSGVAVIYCSFSMLLIGRVISGFFSGNTAICFAALADISDDEKKRAKSFGVISVLAGLSWIAAIIVAGLFSRKQIFNPSVPFFFTSGLIVLSLLMLRFGYVETRKIRQNRKLHAFRGFIELKNAFQIKKLRLLLILYFFWNLSWVTGMEWLAPFLIEIFSASQTGVAIGYLCKGIAWFLGAAVINKVLLQKMSVFSATLLGLFLASLFLTLVAFSFSLVYVIASMSISSLFAAFVWSNWINIVSLEASSSQQGVVLGVNLSLQSLGWMLGPLLGAMLANVWPPLVYLSAGGISFLVLIALTSVKKRYQKMR